MALAGSNEVVLAGIVTSILLLVAFAFLKDSIVSRPAEKSTMSTGSVMSPPRTDLLPPKDEPFTLEQLKQYDGSTAGKPIYVAIKGWFSSERYIWRIS